jgi:hypothetical protein
MCAEYACLLFPGKLAQLITPPDATQHPGGPSGLVLWGCTVGTAASKMHAYVIRAYQMHAYEIHARRPYKMQAY